MQKRQITILFSIILLVATQVATLTACDGFFDDVSADAGIKSDVFLDGDIFTEDDDGYTGVVYHEDVDDDVNADSYCIGPDCEDPDCKDCYWDIVFFSDRNFDWYINQLGTGVDEYINCGPASAVMAALWYSHGEFAVSVEETRNSIPAILNQHWFYTDIAAFLHYYGVDITIANLVTPKYLISWLNEGRILIVNIRAGDISHGDRDSGIGRFYSFNGGHFVILKGFYVVDNVGYFQVYDPFTMFDFYDDGYPMGKDRLFRVDEVASSVDSWGGGQVIIVNNPGQPPTEIGAG